MLNVLRQIYININIYIQRERVFRMQKQPSRGALMKTCPEKYHQIHKKTPTPK